MLIAQQDTAIDCYHGRVQEFASGQCRVILERIRVLRDVFGDDACISELAFDLHMEKSTVSARCEELRKAGRIQWTGCTRKSRASNVTCKTLEIVPVQGRLC